MIVFKIIVYLGTIPFIAFWLWVGTKAVLGKVTMNITLFGKRIQSRWGIVLVAIIFIIKNLLLLSSSAAIDALAIALMEKWQEIEYLWADIIVQISRWNQPWFWDSPYWYSRNRRLGVFFMTFLSHFVYLCVYMGV